MRRLLQQPKVLRRLSAAFAIAAQAGCMTVPNQPKQVLDPFEPCMDAVTCRHLTESEKAALRPLFGKLLPLDKIQLRYRPTYFPWAPGSIAYVNDDYVVSINKGHAWRADYSTSVAGRFLLRHEAYHLVQRRQGMNVAAEVVEAILRHPFNFAENYKYDIIPGKPFSAYNAEAQADIVGIYGRLLDSEAIVTQALQTVKPDPKVYKPALAKFCLNMRAHEDVVAPVFGPGRSRLCAPKGP